MNWEEDIRGCMDALRNGVPGTHLELDPLPDEDAAALLHDVDARDRPTLVRDLASGLSRYLGVPVVATWAVVDPDVPPGRGAANSAQRVAAVDEGERLASGATTAAAVPARR